MKQNPNCAFFLDQLEDLQSGRLTPEIAAQLRGHAESCSQCAMLLRLQEYVVLLGLEDLESAVPEEYVTSMWERLQPDVAPRGSAPSRPQLRRLRAPRWLVPALAATSLFLLLTSGLLLSEWKRMRAREVALVQRIADSERRLAMFESGIGAGPVARTAGLAGTPMWVRLLARRGSVSVADIEALIAGLPPRTTVFSASEWRALEGSIPVWMRSVWTGAAEAIHVEDGVQGEELAALIARLDLEPGGSIPTARILALTAGRGLGRL